MNGINDGYESAKSNEIYRLEKNGVYINAKGFVTGKWLEI